MNHVYTVLWNAVLGRFCVVAELGRKRSRAGTQRIRPGSAPAGPAALAPLMALVVLACAAPSWAARPLLPVGARVVQGEATVATAGTRMTILQNSPKAIIDWQSFDIGRSRRVIFDQPDASSVVLNRVMGGSDSNISGSLQANGRVFLVNPNGVLFGSKAMVDVGSLVASSLDIRNEDFMAGRFQFSTPAGLHKAAKVCNMGTINVADWGAAALLGGDVSNMGRVAAKLGQITLAAGNQITLDFSGDQRLQVSVDQPAFEATVSNSGWLQADGSHVWMTAGATDALLQTVINNTGHIIARNVDARPGVIRLSGATTRVAGTLDAGAEQGVAGEIGISGHQVQILRGTTLTARAEDGAGYHGHLTVQGSDLHVSDEEADEAGSHIDAHALSDALDANAVTLQSSAGDIHVDAPVQWRRHALKLVSPGSIHVNSIMQASGTAALDVTYGGYRFGRRADADTGLNMGL